jgi:hypothetical protein
VRHLLFISLLFAGLATDAQCLIYESGLYRLSICADEYELIRLDDPLEAGKFKGELDRFGDTLILLHPRADSFVRAEFMTANYRVFPIYMDPGVYSVFKTMHEPLIQSRLVAPDGKMLMSWELSDKNRDRIAEFRYNEYLDMDTAYHYIEGVKEGTAWEKFEDRGEQYIWSGSFSQGQREGKWKLLQLKPGYQWKLIAVCRYKSGELLKVKELSKPKPVREIKF